MGKVRVCGDRGPSVCRLGVQFCRYYRTWLSMRRRGEDVKNIRWVGIVLDAGQGQVDQVTQDMPRVCVMRCGAMQCCA